MLALGFTLPELGIRRIRAMGIRDRPVSARSPWQNGYAERLIGSIRRECLDHLVVVGERHLRHVLASYQNTTTRSERTYRCRRTRRFGVMRAEQGACVRRRSWAGYTINMFEFEFPTGTGDRQPFWAYGRDKDDDIRLPCDLGPICVLRRY